MLSGFPARVQHGRSALIHLLLSPQPRVVPGSAGHAMSRVPFEVRLKIPRALATVAVLIIGLQDCAAPAAATPPAPPMTTSPIAAQAPTKQQVISVTERLTAVFSQLKEAPTCKGTTPPPREIVGLLVVKGNVEQSLVTDAEVVQNSLSGASGDSLSPDHPLRACLAHIVALFFDHWALPLGFEVPHGTFRLSVEATPWAVEIDFVATFKAVFDTGIANVRELRLHYSHPRA